MNSAAPRKEKAEKLELPEYVKEDLKKMSPEKR